MPATHCENWQRYHGHLKIAIMSFTSKHLALHVEPNLRSAGFIIAHVIAARVYRSNAFLGRGSADIMPDSRHLAGSRQTGIGNSARQVAVTRLAEGRILIDTSGRCARPDVFTLLVNDRPKTNVQFRSVGREP